MRIHPCLTGTDINAMAIVYDAARDAGASFAEPIFPLAEGVQRWASRDQAENAVEIWKGRFQRRIDELGTPVRLWMPDYELKAEGPEVVRAWMSGTLSIPLNTARYMQGAAAALHELDSEAVLPDGARLVWYGLPKLDGVAGYTRDQTVFASRLIELGAWAVSPSFKIRRRISDGISYAAQRARTRVAASQLIEALGSPELVLPEISCTGYGDRGFDAVPAQDIEAAMLGMKDAGCTQCMLYGQAENEAVARVVAFHVREFAMGAAAAIPKERIP